MTRAQDVAQALRRAFHDGDPTPGHDVMEDRCWQCQTAARVVLELDDLQPEEPEPDRSQEITDLMHEVIGHKRRAIARKAECERLTAQVTQLQSQLDALTSAGPLTQRHQEDFAIAADVDGSLAFSHSSDRLSTLLDALAEHPERYRPGSRVLRCTTTWWETQGVTTYSPFPEEASDG